MERGTTRGMVGGYVGRLVDVMCVGVSGGRVGSRGRELMSVEVGPLKKERGGREGGRRH